MKTQFTGVDTVDFDRDVARHFDRLLPEDVVFGVNEIAKEFRRELVAGSPVGPAAKRGRAFGRTKKGAIGKGYGPIRKGWRRRSTRRIERAAIVDNLTFYGPFVEFGTPPHTIRAHRPGGRRGARRRVLGPSAEGAYFGYQVRHPGTRPRPFVRPVADRASTTAERVLRTVLPRR